MKKNIVLAVALLSTVACLEANLFSRLRNVMPTVSRIAQSIRHTSVSVPNNPLLQLLKTQLETLNKNYIKLGSSSLYAPNKVENNLIIKFNFSMAQNQKTQTGEYLEEMKKFIDILEHDIHSNFVKSFIETKDAESDLGKLFKEEYTKQIIAKYGTALSTAVDQRINAAMTYGFIIRKNDIQYTYPHHAALARTYEDYIPTFSLLSKLTLPNSKLVAAIVEKRIKNLHAQHLQPLLPLFNIPDSQAWNPMTPLKEAHDQITQEIEKQK